MANNVASSSESESEEKGDRGRNFKQISSQPTLPTPPVSLGREEEGSLTPEVPKDPAGKK